MQRVHLRRRRLRREGKKIDAPVLEGDLFLCCCARKNLLFCKRNKNVAAHTGMPAALVPHLIPHPPQTPGFCVSTSQTQSPENVFGSAVQEETTTPCRYQGFTLL
ncbi:unnamed protein product [Urochloa humidicola]